jgi:hypothetical protein
LQQVFSSSDKERKNVLLKQVCCCVSYAREMREKRQNIKDTDREAYEALLKEEAKRSRKNYEKKVPRGKPARRPYKYKDD